MRGLLRREIMRKCPEGFEDELKEFVDEIEMYIDEIKELLNSSGVTDVPEIENATKEAYKLSELLY